MRISDNQALSQVNPIDGVNAYQRQKEFSNHATPVSWGEDMVNISQEAQDKAAAAKEAAESETGIKSAQEEKEEETKAGFSEYMNKAKGKTPAPYSPEEQIKALKEKLVTLQSQMSKLATDTSMPESTKQSRISEINGQINDAMSLISKLEMQKRELEQQETAATTAGGGGFHIG